MLHNAKDGILELGGGSMEYIRFGRGEKHLVMLPGLGDSLRSIKGTALPVALMYRIFAKEYTVWMFSRKRPLPEGCTTRDLARDQAEAMKILGIDRAHIFGVSMGGMISQWLAVDYPEKVAKLVLAVTSPEPNAIMAESVEEWITLAKQGDHAAFMDSNLKRIYSPEYYRKNKWMVPLLEKLTKPKSYERFFIQAQACLTHDALENLHRIRAKTLVIGGEQDLTLGGDASRQLAEAIPDAKLHMYQQWGHGLYEEAKDFNGVVLDFLKE